jgi:hypothetical protein
LKEKRETVKPMKKENYYKKTGFQSVAREDTDTVANLLKGLIDEGPRFLPQHRMILNPKHCQNC